MSTTTPPEQLTPGQRLKFILQQRFGTLKNAAETLQLNPVTLSSYATDRVHVQIDLLSRLSEEMNISTDWIITGIGTPYRTASANGGDAPDLTRQIVRSLKKSAVAQDSTGDVLPLAKSNIDEAESNIAYAFGLEESPTHERMQEHIQHYRYMLFLDPRSAFPLPLEYNLYSEHTKQHNTNSLFPSNTTDDPTEVLYNLLQHSIAPKRRLYCLKDDSMLISGIIKGTLLLMDESAAAREKAGNGDIVVVILNGKFHVRRLRENAKGQSWLESGHPDFPPLIGKGNMKEYVYGTMIAAITMAGKLNRFVEV
jgi:Peptidase S24-like